MLDDVYYGSLCRGVEPASRPNDVRDKIFLSLTVKNPGTVTNGRSTSPPPAQPQPHRYTAYGTWIIYILSLLPAFHVIARTMVPGLPKGCTFPDVVRSEKVPDLLRHRFFFGGYRGVRVATFEFSTITWCGGMGANVA